MNNDNSLLSSSPQMNNKQLTSIIDEFNEDVRLNLSNIKEKALLTSTIRAKWLARYFKEKENLERAIELKNKIIEKKLNNPNAQSKNSLIRIKEEKDLSRNDENVQKLNLVIAQTKKNIEFIERSFPILDGFGFSIKNVIEILRLENV